MASTTGSEGRHARGSKGVQSTHLHRDDSAGSRRLHHPRPRRPVPPPRPPRDLRVKAPKYTDTARYPRGYTKSNETDIRKTFERIRREQREKAERQQHVVQLQRRKAKV